MIAEFNQCVACKHVLVGAGCAAFGVIPGEIAMDRHDHRSPSPEITGSVGSPKEPGVKHPLNEIP